MIFNNLLDLINKTSSNVFIPVSVGGGIKTLKDIELILKNGADKVFINSAAIKKPKFLDEAVKNFGSSTISISIEANKKKDGEYIFDSDNFPILENDFEYIATKLGISVDDLQTYFKAPNKKYTDYSNQMWLYNIGARIMRALGVENGGKR